MICPTCRGAQHIEGGRRQQQEDIRAGVRHVLYLPRAEEAKRIAEKRGRLKERK